MKHTWTRLLFAASLLWHQPLVFSIPRSSLENIKPLRASIEARLVGKVITLRQVPNYSTTLYFGNATNSYIVALGVSGLFPTKEEVGNITVSRVDNVVESEILARKVVSDVGKPIVTEDIRDYRHYWRLTLKHRSLGKGELRVTKGDGGIPDNVEEVVWVLGFLFNGEGFPNHSLVCGNAESKRLHYYGSGHVPEEIRRKQFESVDEGIKSGYALCPLCFRELRFLANFEVEMNLGTETEANIRHYFPFSKDSRLQEQVERVASKVLKNWSIPLKGYKYRFNVLDSDAVNARACAGGYIFVDRGLLNAIESEEELEAALAHEIAHVEQRHGIKEYREAQSSATGAAILGAVVTMGAATATAASKSEVSTSAAYSAVGLTHVILELARRAALIGYSKAHEKEADALALMYCEKQKISKAVFVNVLKKIRTEEDISNFGSHRPSLLSSHPSTSDRLFVAENISVKSPAKDLVFDAYSKDDELIYSFHVYALAGYIERDGTRVTRILGEVKTTAALANPQKVTGLSAQRGSFSQTLVSDGVIDIYPLDSIGVSFYEKGKKLELLDEPYTFTLNGIQIGRIAKRE